MLYNKKEHNCANSHAPRIDSRQIRFHYIAYANKNQFIH